MILVIRIQSRFWLLIDSSSNRDFFGSTPHIGSISNCDILGSTPQIGSISDRDILGSTPQIGSISDRDILGSTPHSSNPDHDMKNAVFLKEIPFHLCVFEVQKGDGEGHKSLTSLEPENHVLYIRQKNHVLPYFQKSSNFSQLAD